tara:strand:- start:394 stop:594 length:201 start_codon:yes stop_codon:yes gene_type:complete
MLMTALEMMKELKPTADRKPPKKTEKQLFVVPNKKCPKGKKVCNCKTKPKCVDNKLVSKRKKKSIY